MLSVVAAPIVVRPCLTVNVTEPLLTAGPLAGVTVALSVTEVSPYVAVALATAVVVLTLPPLNVTVRDPLLPKTRLHGLVVPEQVDEVVPETKLHPPKVDPPFAVANRVIIAPLSEVEIFGEHVLETVCDAAGAPVPPQDTGA